MCGLSWDIAIGGPMLTVNEKKIRRTSTRVVNRLVRDGRIPSSNKNFVANHVSIDLIRFIGGTINFFKEEARKQLLLDRVQHLSSEHLLTII
jgi:hypothetical protein